MNHEFQAKEIRFYSLGVNTSVRSLQETESILRRSDQASLQVLTIYKDMPRVRGAQGAMLSILALARSGNKSLSLGLKGKGEAAISRTLGRPAGGKSYPQGAMAFHRRIKSSCKLSGRLLRNTYPKLTLLPTAISFLPEAEGKNGMEARGREPSDSPQRQSPGAGAGHSRVEKESAATNRNTWSSGEL